MFNNLYYVFAINAGLRQPGYITFSSTVAYKNINGNEFYDNIKVSKEYAYIIFCKDYYKSRPNGPAYIDEDGYAWYIKIEHDQLMNKSQFEAYFKKEIDILKKELKK